MQAFLYDGELDLIRTLRPICRGRFDPTFILERHRVLRATRTPQGPATLKIVHEQRGRVEADAWGPGAAWALERVPKMLGLDTPSPSAEEVCAGAIPDVVQQAARKCRGMRLSLVAPLFEVVVPIVLEQLVTGKESKRAFTRLVRTFAEPAPGPVEDLWLPPAPEHIRSIPGDEFLSLGIIRQQGLTLRELSRRARRLEEAAAMLPDDAYARLTAFKGIGPWTAGSLQLYALGHADAVIEGDYHLPNVVAWNLAGEDRADDARMLELLAPFAGHRGRVQRWIEVTGAAAPRYGPRRAVRGLDRPAWRSQGRSRR